MNIPTEPEGGYKARLIAYNSTGNIFGGVPIEINGQKLQTDTRGIFDLKDFIGKKISRILINGIQLSIGFGNYILKKHDTIIASVREKAATILSSDNILPPHLVGSQGS